MKNFWTNCLEVVFWAKNSLISDKLGSYDLKFQYIISL